MKRRWLFPLILAAVGCGPRKPETPIAASDSAPLAAPPASAPVRGPPPAAAASPPAALPTVPTVEAEAPSLGCADVSPFCSSRPCSAAEGSTWPRACVVRGRITAVRRAAARVHAGKGEEVAALVVEIEPAEDAGCVTPLDEAAGTLAEPEAGYADKVTATKIELVGASPLEPELRAGRSLCGWAKGGSTRPIYGPPKRWEGQISDADGTLLVAASAYLDPSASRMLARRFRFAREGTPTRVRIDEGGWFVRHPAVRVGHRGKSVVVRDGEQRLPLPDGSHLAVRAGSLLTAGPVPVFVGTWDGYSFSALRVP